MDRNRDRRPRDIPPEDRYGNGGGQSYRPGNVRDRSPPRMGGFRPRSPPRRAEFMDSYRTGPGRSRSPPRRDDFRRRSPSPRGFRDRDRDLRGGDMYRNRPRSPLPPRRDDLPRDDLFRRDDREFRDQRDFRDDRDRGFGPPPHARSPPPPRFRDRSPLPLKRGREPSPISSRGRRTPPPPKRDRIASPPRGRYDDLPSSRPVSPPRRRFSPLPTRDRRPSPPPNSTLRDYRPRSRSPFSRPDRVDPRAVDDWRRPRSPLPEHRPAYLSREEVGQRSSATSRHSSPPVHPSRLVALQQNASDDRAPSSRASPRDPRDEREPLSAADSTASRPPFAHGTDPPPRAEKDVVDSTETTLTANVRQEDAPATARAPPTGPGGQRGPIAPASAPTGPAAVLAAPAGPRASVAPPSGPRGAPVSRGDIASRGRGGFGGEYATRGRGSYSATFRGPRGGAPPSGPSRSDTYNRASNPPLSAESSRPSLEPSDSSPAVSRQPPSGPRNTFSQPSPQQLPPTAPGFRPSPIIPNAPAFPRAQRLPSSHDPNTLTPDIPTGPKNARRPLGPTDATLSSSSSPSLGAPRVHPALADLPRLVDGGVRAEPLADRAKALRLEEEAEKLRRQIDERDARRRKTLRDWDRMTRETELAALRSELAEEALRKLNGEDLQQAAF